VNVDEMSSISIINPASAQFLLTGTPIKGATLTFTGPSLLSATTTQALGNNWEVFIPYGNFTAARIVNPIQLLDALNNNSNNRKTIYSIVGTASAALQSGTLADPPTSITIDTSTTIFIPLPVFSTPTPIVEIQSSIDALASVSYSTPTNVPTNGATSSPASQPTSNPASPSFGLSPSTSSSATGALNSTMSPGATAAPFYNNDPSLAGISKGGLGGTIVGVFLLALLTGLLLGLLFKRKKSTQSREQGHFKPVDDTAVISSAAFGRKGTPEMTETRFVADWQKHAKQGEAEGTIKQKVSSLFELVEVHVAEFYGAAQASLTTKPFDSLQVLAPNDFAKMSAKSIETPALLKGMLNRCIVHKISLQSDPAQSLLPLEYTQLPEKIKWSMEQDGEDIGHSAELRPGEIVQIAPKPFR
jgi:hypothetical protein